MGDGYIIHDDGRPVGWLRDVPMSREQAEFILKYPQQFQAYVLNGAAKTLHNLPVATQ